MPITQSRMIALLRAAQDYKQALESVCETLARQDEQHRTGQITIKQAAAVCFMSARAVVMLSDPIHSAETIGIEAAHFRANERRNNKKATKAREHRQAAGTPIAPTAPSRMDGTFTRGQAIATRLGAAQTREHQHQRWARMNPEDLQAPTSISEESRREAEAFVKARERERQLAGGTRDVPLASEEQIAEAERLAAEERMRKSNAEMDAGTELGDDFGIE